MSFTPFPGEGDGLSRHDWCLIRANQLRNAGLLREEALAVIKREAAGCEAERKEELFARCIPTALDKVFDSTPGQYPRGGKSVTKAKPKPKPKRDEAAIRGVLEKFADWDIDRLIECSPYHDCTTMDVAKRLWKPDDLICAGLKFNDHETKTLEEWGDDLAKRQLVVPSPMSKRRGMTMPPKSHKSARTRENAAPQWCRPYVVCEWDDKLSDDPEEHLQLQVPLIVALSQVAPLIVATMSGSKSIHAMFVVRGFSEEKLKAFTTLARTLGADKKIELPEQFFRMPGGTRINKDGTTAEQRIIYFDPDLTNHE